MLISGTYGVVEVERLICSSQRLGGMGAFKSMPVRKEVSEISAGNWSPSGAQRRIDLEACKLLALTRQEEMGWAPVVG